MRDKSIPVDGWFEEKVVNSLEETASAADWAQRLEELKIHLFLPEEQRHKYELLLDGVLSELYAAIFDLTKVASVLRKDRAWKPTDPQEVFGNAREGLAKVLVEYDLADWLGPLSKTDAPSSTVKATLQKVRELSQGTAGENRAFIYDELSKIPRNSLSKKILDLLEPVTNGDKSWPLFQKEIQELLKDE